VAHARLVRVFALKQRLLTAHMSIGNKMNGMPERRSILWYNLFFGQTPENAKLLGLPKKHT
jgi:hypothetical protein